MKTLRLKNLSKRYPASGKNALDSINFELDSGSLCAIVGQSGSGKSTLLRSIAGIESSDHGETYIDGVLVESKDCFIPANKRKIGFVFQNFALFPHLTIYENIAFGIHKNPKKKEIVNELLQLIKLDQMGPKYPHELSGGEQQRIALARAIAPKPSLLLLDEPFSSLDHHIKKHIRSQVFDIVRSTHITCIFVTHDIEDALEFADEIIILNDGKILQKGKPIDLYRRPKNRHVAELFGDINFLSPAELDYFGLYLKDSCDYGVHPSKIQYSFKQVENFKPAKLLNHVFMGEYTILTVETLAGLKMNVQIDSEDTIKGDTTIYIHVSENNLIPVPKS